MKKNQNWNIPLAGAMLAATFASAETIEPPMPEQKDRLSLSVEYGLNISGKFTGIGGSLNSQAPRAAFGRRTPRGNWYNYDDGYVYRDISGSHDGLTWFWGYDNSAAQISGTDILMHRTTLPGLPAERDGNSNPYLGAELTYERELGVKEDWHEMHYGLQAAISYLPVTLKDNFAGKGTARTRTDAYPFTSGTTPPAATPGHPYRGSYGGPGFLIGVAPESSMTSFAPANFYASENFDATLWGLHLGPYVEFPLGKNFSLQVAGGIALGLLDGDLSWQQGLALNGSRALSGSGGDDQALLWGGYVAANVSWQFAKNWAVFGGVQFQDLGTYEHNFAGRGVNLDLSQSLFVHAGISYSFK